ncbi:MAG: thiamine phosphate synthase [Candidatus Omnitrophica bacterium]|nr:thiamine phosphate synthase [Candidatus Omnitrophota bacterium]
MNWKDKVFKNFRLYAVTDLKESDDSILKKIEDVYRGGADIVQLRSKGFMDGALFRLGLKVKKIAAKQKKLYFVNDRLDLALATGADGLHVGQDDFPVSVVRRTLARTGAVIRFLGKSTHSLEQALKTSREDVDYLGLGPIFSTPTKSHYKPIGLNLISQVHEKVGKPIVVIGGIDSQNLNQVLDAGAERVAVVRALFHQKDSYEAARCLRQILEKYEQTKNDSD